MGGTEDEQLVQSNEILDLFGNIQTANSDMIIKNVTALDFPTNGELRNNEMCFYKIFDSLENTSETLEELFPNL